MDYDKETKDMSHVKSEATNKDLAAIESAIFAFADEMYQRMKKKYEDGKRGWNQMNLNESIRTDIAAEFHRININREDGRTIDLANYAMMLWHQSVRLTESKRD